MESKWDEASDTQGSGAVDAAADLALLSRARSTVDVDQFLDFGPWWYAPLIAALVASASLFAEASGSLLINAVFALVAIGSGSFLALHDYRRRNVRMRRSWRGMVFIAPTVIICLAVVVAWGAAATSIGYPRFVPGYAILGWGLTTLVFLGLRATLLAIRERRGPLQ